MRVRKGKLEYAFGLYLNVDGQRVIGKEEAEILEALEEFGSIAAAAKKRERSYKFTWNCLIRMTEDCTNQLSSRVAVRPDMPRVRVGEEQL